ncbi:uncharacterized protein NPIL_116711 [Nephila pilipes]|uniref:Uncharacterized protein n=1 Tax=Nephila pilipes TaxID=299642 RepID=A0A8X6KMT7_NEPPI|nr:uncharacterized protein NPIL_116711 [Nephila pilipes]
MRIPPEFEIIFKSLSLAGVIFSGARPIEKTESKVKGKIKSLLKSLVEISFVAISIILVFASITYGDEYKTTLKVTTTTINIILLLLRVSLLLKKNAILSALSKLHSFRNSQRNRGSPHIRKYVALTCGLCFLFPIAMIIHCIIETVSNPQEYFRYLGVSCDQKILCIIYIIATIIAYVFSYIVFPGLLVALLSFTYLLFSKTFEQHLDELRLRLLENFSKKEISRALLVFKAAKKTHLRIEKAVSLLTFLTYALTFGNIFQVMSTFVTGFATDTGILQTTYSYITFIWSVVWFLALTMCGTDIRKTEFSTKNMAQDVITKNLVKNLDGQSELEYMNLFNTCSDLDLRFTGWGMFVLDKKMILTITGIMVTYGALFVTEVRKMPENI